MARGARLGSCLLAILLSGCAAQVPAGMREAIQQSVVAATETETPPRCGFTRVRSDSFDVEEASVAGDSARVRARVGISFGNTCSPAGVTSHNVLDDQFTLQRREGRWTVVRDTFLGFAPGGGP